MTIQDVRNKLIEKVLMTEYINNWAYYPKQVLECTNYIKDVRYFKSLACNLNSNNADFQMNLYFSISRLAKQNKHNIIESIILSMASYVDRIVDIIYYDTLHRNNVEATLNLLSLDLFTKIFGEYGTRFDFLDNLLRGCLSQKERLELGKSSVVKYDNILNLYIFDFTKVLGVLSVNDTNPAYKLKLYEFDVLHNFPIPYVEKALKVQEKEVLTTTMKDPTNPFKILIEKLNKI